MPTSPASTTDYDLTPVPHASTVEIGTACPRKCEGCAFQDTPLARLSENEMIQAISTLSDYWDYAEQDPEHQLVGDRIVEFIGGAGLMNRLSGEDLRTILETGYARDLRQVAFMCDAEKDGRAIQDFFTEAAKLEEKNRSGMKAIVALSADSLPKPEETDFQREQKSNGTWEMLNNRDKYIKDPETQNFRLFTTISNRNLDEIPEIAERALESGSLLFIAPLTIHSPEVLEKTGVEGRLLMGTDTNLLLTEEDKPRMEKVVKALRELKEKYPKTFLNVDATFNNMIACCKPIIEAFQGNCRDRCEFTTKDGEQLITTPNFRVMRHPRTKEGDLSLGICTCMVGPRDSKDNYANTSLSYLGEIVNGNGSSLELIRKLTADLLEAQCPGCNCRTSIDIKRGQVLL